MLLESEYYRTSAINDFETSYEARLMCKAVLHGRMRNVAPFGHFKSVFDGDQAFGSQPVQFSLIVDNGPQGIQRFPTEETSPPGR